MKNENANLSVNNITDNIHKNDEYIFITFKDFEDLINNNGNPIYYTPTITTNFSGGLQSVISLYTTYNKISAVYYVYKYASWYWPIMKKFII